MIDHADYYVIIFSGDIFEHGEKPGGRHYYDVTSALEHIYGQEKGRLSRA